jgi:hypothetical protein
VVKSFPTMCKALCSILNNTHTHTCTHRKGCKHAFINFISFVFLLLPLL